MSEPAGLVPDAAGHREFEVDGTVWLAEVTGECVAGGVMGPAALESVHFRCPDDPTHAVRLAYVPRGSFARLHDEELLRLHRSAPALAPRPDPAPRGGRRRVDGTR